MNRSDQSFGGTTHLAVSGTSELAIRNNWLLPVFGAPWSRIIEGDVGIPKPSR